MLQIDIIYQFEKMLNYTWANIFILVRAVCDESRTYGSSWSLNSNIYSSITSTFTAALYWFWNTTT